MGKATEHYIQLEFNPPILTTTVARTLKDLSVNCYIINGETFYNIDGKVTSVGNRTIFDHIQTRRVGFGCEDFDSERIEEFGDYALRLLKLVRIE